MSVYLWIKWLHILSATVLFGTGIGIAWFKWTADRGGDVRVIRAMNERVVLADWLFTAPAAILQPLTGWMLAHVAGLPLTTPWVMNAIALYALAGACWLMVVWLQLQMRDLALVADREGLPLPARYRRLSQAWFWLGVAAFVALLAIFRLMVFKPV